MAVRPNTITRDYTVEALDKEFIANYRGELDRLVEFLGMFDIQTLAAGNSLYQYKVTGQLLNAATDPGTIVYQKTSDKDVVTGKTYYTKSGDTYTEVQSPAKADLKDYYVAYASPGSSSGTEYVEGDRIARSLYKVEKIHIGDVEFVPYAKQTTAQAILKGGYENSIGRTDRKAVREMRSDILNKFFALLENGTNVVAPAAGGTYGLQQLLAFMDATLKDSMETNGDGGDDVDAIYFVNRQDAAAYLANAPVTMQTAFGMTYLESFLGVQNVMLTNKVQQGTVRATTVENIHIYGMDFGTLASTELAYATDELGLIGVHHAVDYDHASAETYLVRSTNFIPEVLDYIVKGSMTPVA